MKYRRETPQDKFLKFLYRGVFGIGLLVIGLSVTQGLNGVIGTLIMILLVSVFWSIVQWFAGMFEGLYHRLVRR